MSFATLSNDDLLAVFEGLPVATLLYCLPRMCRRWNCLLATACRARQELILDDGTWGIDFIQYTILLPFEHLLVREDGSPYLRLLANRHPAILDLNNGVLASEPGRLPLHSLAGHLVSLFSNIHHLYISMHPSTETLALAVPLINTWAAQLTTLHLIYVSFGGQLEPATRKEAAHTLTSLLEGINCCKSLKRLHFNVELNAGTADDETASPIQLHLPVFNRLSSLSFKTCNFSSSRDVNLPLNDLRRHVQAKIGSLRRVAVTNHVTLSELTQMEPHLFCRFVRLRILDQITLSTLPTLVLLCTRFLSLRALGLIFTVPMCLLVGALAPLTNLEHLDLTYNLSNVPPNTAYGVHVQQASPERPLRSVKYLSLSYSLPSHEKLTRLALVEHFPSLQYAKILNASNRCRDCGYRKAPGVPFDAQRFDCCAQLAVRDYFRAFAHLRIVNVPRRLDWRRWAKEKWDMDSHLPPKVTSRDQPIVRRYSGRIYYANTLQSSQNQH